MADRLESSFSELQYEFAAEFAPGVVKEAAKLRAVQVGLNVPRVEVIKDVKNSDACSRLEFLLPQSNRERSAQLNVERRKSREAILIAWPDVFTKLVLHGVRKSSMQVVNGNQGQLPRPRECSPQQQP